MRKGFIHVVEIIIVTVAVFLIIYQVSQIPRQNSDWESMELYTRANDILFSLDSKGVDWFDPAGVDNALHSSFPSNTVYNLRIKNAMKPEIKVGCICNASQLSQVTNALNYFEINGQPVRFTITQIQPASIAFSHEHDVIVAFEQNLDSYSAQISRFLEAGKGIVKVQDIRNSPEDVMNKLFNVDWDGLLPSPSRNVYFYSNESSEPYYNIYKYFHSIPIYQQNFTYASLAAGWPTGGAWSIGGGVYIGNSPASPSTALYAPTLADRYSFRASFRAGAGYANNVTFVMYYQNAQNNVFVSFDFGSPDRVTAWENITGTQNFRGKNSSYTLSPGTMYDVKVVPLQNGRLNVYVNGSMILTTNPVTIPPASTQIGFQIKNGQASFDNVAVTFADNHTFSQNLLDSNEKTLPNTGGTKPVLNNSASACIAYANIVNGNGRTAWLTNYNDMADQDMRNMLRTLVVWAAGEENEVIKGEVKNVPVVASIYKTYDKDMFQPVEIVLTMGNLYK
ncbi:MAG TPA: hypothetical protein VJ485_00325 [archaeon]|nr:hypothetical protein [archaeon]